jgi:hypothetical protein
MIPARSLSNTPLPAREEQFRAMRIQHDIELMHNIRETFDLMHGANP